MEKEDLLVKKLENTDMGNFRTLVQLELLITLMITSLMGNIFLSEKMAQIYFQNQGIYLLLSAGKIG